MKSIIASLTLFFFFQLCFGQQNFDVKVEPNPLLESKYYNPKIERKNIKSLTTILKNQRNYFQPDTISIEYFNELGEPIESFRYDKGKPSRKSIYTYNNKKLKERIRTINLLVNDKYDELKYTYFPNGKLKSIDNFYISKGNTESYTSSIFSYQNDNLIKKTRFENGRSTYFDSFSYSKNRLLKHFHIPISGIGNYDNEYTYNQDNLLIKKVLSFITKEKNTSEIVSQTMYEYEKDKVVKLTDWSMGKSYMENKPVVSTFTYNENNLLETMNVTFDTLYRNVTFNYESKQLSSVDVITNISSSGYLVFWIPYSDYLTNNYPITYREEFEYDEKGNLIRKRGYSEKELISEALYHLEY